MEIKGETTTIITTAAPPPPPLPLPVGRLVDSSQADDRRVIQLVRARRLLYARNTMPVASYYAQVKKQWKEVADEMGWSVGDVRRKWSHIRNSYSRHLRNEVTGARTGRGRAVSRWYLADELEFLREHMATDTRTSSMSSPSMSYAPSSYLQMEVSSEPFGGSVGGGSPPDVKVYAPWMAAEGCSPPARAEPKQEPHSVYSEDSSEYPPSPATPAASFAADEDSSYFQFFRGLYSDYCELSPQLQRRFKRQCLASLHSLLDGADPPQPAPLLSSPRTILPTDD